MASAGDRVFDEWVRITRFLEGARIAFAREDDLWTSLQIADRAQIEIKTGKGGYTVDVESHLEAVRDEETLLASVLIHTYALTQAAAAERLSLNLRQFGAIEDWGTRLLRAEGNTWEDVPGNLAGAVEAAVTRNAFAHGTRVIDSTDEARLRAAGHTRLSAGDTVTLDYSTLKSIRTRLRHLLGAGGINRSSP